jgi:hypothetical protein
LSIACGIVRCLIFSENTEGYLRRAKVSGER